jgi:hypothetical protein
MDYIHYVYLPYLLYLLCLLRIFNYLFIYLIDLYSYLAIESRIGTLSLQVGHSHSFQSCSTLISDRPKHAVDSVCLRDVHHEHGANALLCCASVDID